MPANNDEEAPVPTATVLSVITRAEDEALDEDETLMDLRDNKTDSNKTPAAIKQFNFFLKHCCKKKGCNDPSWNRTHPISSMDQIPHEG